MANLKSLLSTTLTSFLNSKRAWSTNQVMPSATNITITPETVSEISENYFMFTAPYDGWVSLSGSRDGTSSSFPSFYVASRAVGGGITGVAFGYFITSFPVKAGQVVRFWATNMAEKTVLLYRAVSGT